MLLSYVNFNLTSSIVNFQIREMKGGWSLIKDKLVFHHFFLLWEPCCCWISEEDCREYLIYYLDFIHLQFVLLISALVLFASSFFLRAFSKEDVIYKGIFQQSQEHEHKATHQVNINCFDIRDLWQGLPEVSADGCHCQDCGDSYETERHGLAERTC